MTLRSVSFRDLTVPVPRSRAHRDGWQRFLHPVWIFGSLWLLVFLVWGLMPEDMFREVAKSDRYFSVTSLSYFMLAIFMMFAGIYIGPALFKTGGEPRIKLGVESDATLRIIQRGMFFALTVGTTIIGLILARATLNAGGPSQLVGQLFSGASWSHVSELYFEPARIQGLTVWVQLNFAVAPLGVLGMLMAQRRRLSQRPYQFALGLAFLNTLVLTFVMTDRLASYEFLVAAGVTWAGGIAARRISVPFARVATFAGVVILAFSLVWMLSEFGRTYLARFGPDVSLERRIALSRADDPGSGTLATNQFLAYLVSGLNNGMYTVDHFDEHTLVFRSAKGIFTTFQIEDSESSPFIPGLAQASQVLDDIYDGETFTVFSAPGYAFMDLSWGGAVILFWFGVGIGAVYTRFRSGEMWGLAIYPILVVGLLDSFRTFYWSESRAMVPVAFILVIMYFAYSTRTKKGQVRRR